MVRLFLEGGSLLMTVLTIEFILLILAAWKAPAWVKEIGIIALITGIFSILLTFHALFEGVQKAGMISTEVIFGGFKVAMIPLFYGMIIYFLSLIIRIIQKPRI
ncbi:MAG: hypothetical protein CVU13_05030 [Bacteroidetes bacterium HGW-Bacteroidetes-8]|nr:MAG: hypothetical protein CVU13_05030 [Bacteroidetes bacterium HGW-Bacteroidetes-8]